MTGVGLDTCVPADEEPYSADGGDKGCEAADDDDCTGVGSINEPHRGQKDTSCETC